MQNEKGTLSVNANAITAVQEYFGLQLDLFDIAGLIGRVFSMIVYLQSKD